MEPAQLDIPQHPVLPTARPSPSPAAALEHRARSPRDLWHSRTICHDGPEIGERFFPGVPASLSGAGERLGLEIFIGHSAAFASTKASLEEASRDEDIWRHHFQFLDCASLGCGNSEPSLKCFGEESWKKESLNRDFNLTTQKACQRGHCLAGGLLDKSASPYRHPGDKLHEKPFHFSVSQMG